MAFDPTLWKINNKTFAELGITEPHLVIGNMVDDVFTFSDPGADFDEDPLFADEQAIILKRGNVIVFQGTIAEVPRFMGATAESISYKAIGPWSLLRECAFLQHHNYAVHPKMPVPSLVTQYHGRVVLGQAIDGTSLTIAQVIAGIVNSAIAAGRAIALGSIADFNTPGVWDEVTDFYCDAAIIRTLNIAPDAVVWWDYSVTPPTFNLGRRASITEVTLAVPPPGKGNTAPYAPFEEISLTPMPRLVSNTAIVFYRSTDTTGTGARDYLEYEAAGTSPEVLALAALEETRAGKAAAAIEAQHQADGALRALLLDPSGEGFSENYEEKLEAANTAWGELSAAASTLAAAVLAAAQVPRAIVRTVDLAGARNSVNNIVQPIRVRPIFARLVFEAPVRAAPNTGNLLPGDNDFNNVAAFWKRRAEWLAGEGVIIRAFRKPTRVQATPDDFAPFNPACAFELLPGGSITDWMKDKRGIVSEEQIFTVQVVADVPREGGGYTRVGQWPNLVTLTTRILATNAQTQKYAYATEWSFEKKEEKPYGLPAQLLSGHTLLPYQGGVTVVEEEAALTVTTRNALNLACEKRPEWAGMRALVQSVDVDITSGRSRLTIGMPKQLGRGDQKQTMLTNQTKREVATANARQTGNTGSDTQPTL